jgi:hypothetical protein
LKQKSELKILSSHSFSSHNITINNMVGRKNFNKAFMQFKQL